MLVIRTRLCKDQGDTRTSHTACLTCDLRGIFARVVLFVVEYLSTAVGFSKPDWFFFRDMSPADDCPKRRCSHRGLSRPESTQPACCRLSCCRPETSPPRSSRPGSRRRTSRWSSRRPACSRLACLLSARCPLCGKPTGVEPVEVMMALQSTGPVVSQLAAANAVSANLVACKERPNGGLPSDNTLAQQLAGQLTGGTPAAALVVCRSVREGGGTAGRRGT